MKYEKYEIDLGKFLSAPGLALQAFLKNTKIKLDLLTHFAMLLMVEKGIIERICPSFYQYEIGNRKYMKDDHKIKESSYLEYWNVNNLYGWRMSQNLPVNNFEWIEDISQFNEDFTKSYNEESDEGYFLKADDKNPEKLYELPNDLPFLLERMKIEKNSKTLLLIYIIKVNMLFTQEI